jgi:carbonic anhydrase
VPFVSTVVAILFTDLLIGILIGLLIGFAFVIARNFRPAISFVCHEDACMVRARRNLYFITNMSCRRCWRRSRTAMTC